MFARRTFSERSGTTTAAVMLAAIINAARISAFEFVPSTIMLS
jgi:hypothetical protein